MTVADYYNDMILGQKWAIEVEHINSDPTEEEPPIFNNNFFETLHFSVPCGRCSYFKNEVRYFRVFDDTIYLSVKDFKENNYEC